MNLAETSRGFPPFFCPILPMYNSEKCNSHVTLFLIYVSFANSSIF